MLVIEVSKAFRDDPNCRVVKWNEAAKLLNKTFEQTELADIPYACCYGEAFSGNWAKYGQNSFMIANNIEWRVWDLPDKQCPNGFFSHMFSGTKGHHVKKVPCATAKLGKTGPLIQSNEETLIAPAAPPVSYIYHQCRDPNYLNVREINVKLHETFTLQGIPNPGVADVKRLLFNMTKLNINLCNRLNRVSNHGESEDTNGIRKISAVSTTSPSEEHGEEESLTGTEMAERACTLHAKGKSSREDNTYLRSYLRSDDTEYDESPNDDVSILPLLSY